MSSPAGFGQFPEFARGFLVRPELHQRAQLFNPPPHSTMSTAHTPGPWKLPLPVPTHFRNGVLYAFSADQIRADRIKVWELAMRTAQEGREPVARVELMQTGGNAGLATRIVEIDDPLRERLRPGALLYASTPPKSDEARDALISIGGQLASVAFNLAQRAGHALTGDDVAMLDKLRKQWDATLAAQQKGGAV